MLRDPSLGTRWRPQEALVSSSVKQAQVTPGAAEEKGKLNE